MESEGGAKEAVVSEPLQHLLSLKWETLPDVSTMVSNEKTNKKTSMHVKKVRFSDEIEQSYLETYCDEHNLKDKNCDSIESNQKNYETLNGNELELSENNNEISNSFFDLKQSVENSNIKPLHDSFESYDSDIETLNSDKEVISEGICNDHDELNEYFNNCHINSKEELSLNKDNSNGNKSDFEHLNPEKNMLENHLFEKTAVGQNENSLSSTFVEKCDIDFEKKVISSPENNKIIKHSSHQKQTEKINRLLNKFDKFSSVPDMKVTVTEVWHSIKKKDIKITNKDNHKTEKTVLHGKSAKIKVKGTSQNLKFKKKRRETDTILKNFSQSDFKVEKSKEDREENEMAYKSWKKQKDILLKQEALKKLKEQEEKKIFMLMNKEIKKENAESAYLLWLAHKAENSHKEKLKQTWILEKSEKANEFRIERDKAALQMYNLWLENKFSKEKQISLLTQKPPWIPQG